MAITGRDQNNSADDNPPTNQPQQLMRTIPGYGLRHSRGRTAGKGPLIGAFCRQSNTRHQQR